MERRTMMNIKSSTAGRPLTMLFAMLIAWTLCLAGNANAQRTATIDAGTAITVRTNETINARDSDGRIYSGVVAQDVIGRGGYVVLPEGSDVDLVVRQVSRNELALDLDSVVVNGQRYGVETEQNIVQSDSDRGLGVNQRTGKYVGGGAVLGAIIGAIAGGGKGAAIGAGAGAAAGAGYQTVTRGKSVRIPAESLLTFRLAEPLRAGVVDPGYMRDGRRYHTGYIPFRDANMNSAAYADGLSAGRVDAQRGLPRNVDSYRWRNRFDRRDYEAGYIRGYQYYLTYAP